MSDQPSYTMSLDRDDGTTETVLLNLDFSGLDEEEKERAMMLWDHRDRDHLAAALIFVGTGLADEDFITVGPTLVQAVRGKIDWEVVG